MVAQYLHINRKLAQRLQSSHCGSIVSALDVQPNHGSATRWLGHEALTRQRATSDITRP